MSYLYLFFKRKIFRKRHNGALAIVKSGDFRWSWNLVPTKIESARKRWKSHGWRRL